MCPTVPVSSRAAAALTPSFKRSFFAMAFGDSTVIALSDGQFELPAGRLLIGDRPGQVDALLAQAGLAPVVRSAVNAFLIDTGEARILIDAGAGELQGAGLGQLGVSLRDAGYVPEDIDAVLLTHLHPDHVGGIAREGRRVFPAATVWADAREVAFWCDTERRARVDESVRATFDGAIASLRPYMDTGRLRTFAPGQQPVPGIHALALEGHTQGHAGFRMERDGESLVICGDVLHVAPVQLAQPRLAIRYDSEPARACDARERLLAEAAARGDWLAAAHAPFPGIGRVRREGHGFAWLAYEGCERK